MTVSGEEDTYATEASFPWTTSANESTTNTAVLYGLGSSNAQSVMDYIARKRQSFFQIFWIPASCRQSIEAEYIKIASRLLSLENSSETTKSIFGTDLIRDFDVNSSTSSENAVQSMVEWLRHPRNTSWLLILDGLEADTLKDISAQSPLDFRAPEEDLYWEVSDLLPIAARNHGQIIIIAKHDLDLPQAFHYKFERNASLQQPRVRAWIKQGEGA